ncbi:major latex protein 149-like [Hevea brasiliensis]|uniref:major latex protein 149-like n=1 Tax=Hevea brasiliensis TaxID=3981 RepID=UPI0025EA0EB1|nr:major latex protein 149-like [Hevea brasiliensis]
MTLLAENINGHGPNTSNEWANLLDGAEVFKEKIMLDEEKKKELIGPEGDAFKIYKVYNGIWELIPKDQGSLAKVNLEYKKLNENVPVPDKYMDFLISMTRKLMKGSPSHKWSES